MRLLALALAANLASALPTPKAPIEYRTVQVQPGISLDVVRPKTFWVCGGLVAGWGGCGDAAGRPK